jgi:Dynein heavy chain, N-terminal region 2
MNWTISLKIKDVESLYIETFKVLFKNLPESPCLKQNQAMIQRLSYLSPLLKSLLWPYLKELHLEELRKLLNKVCWEDWPDKIITKTITISELEKIDLLPVRESIIQLSNKAYHEDFLTNKLKEIKSNWSIKSIPTDILTEKNGVTCLGDLRDFLEELEDTLQTIWKILSNKHVTIIQRDTEEFQKNLLKVNDIVESLKKLQQRWILYDDLFSWPDLKKQMGNEFATFENSSKMLLNIFKKIEVKNHALSVWRIPQIDDHILKITANQTILQTNIELHLNNKRQSFYRLYLLSDQELVDILANFYKNLNIFNTYLGKMFDSVNSIRLNEGIGETFINAIISNNQEIIQFDDIPFSAKESLEETLELLQGMMRMKIKDLIVKKHDEILIGSKEEKFETFDLEKFVKDNVMQCSLLAFECFWMNFIYNCVSKQDDEFLGGISNMIIYRNPI